MMNTQQSFATFLGSVVPDAVRALPAGHVVALGNGGGQVSILAGRVWLTSGSDPDDHVLGAGETFEVRDSGPTLVEAWSRGDPALIAWRPRSPGSPKWSSADSLAVSPRKKPRKHWVSPSALSRAIGSRRECCCAAHSPREQRYMASRA